MVRRRSGMEEAKRIVRWRGSASEMEEDIVIDSGDVCVLEGWIRGLARCVGGR